MWNLLNLNVSMLRCSASKPKRLSLYGFKLTWTWTYDIVCATKTNSELNVISTILVKECKENSLHIFVRTRCTVGGMRPFIFLQKKTEQIKQKKNKKTKTRGRHRCLWLNHKPPLDMCTSEQQAKKRDMLWELWEQKQFSPWDKQEASPRPAPFLLCSPNGSTETTKNSPNNGVHPLSVEINTRSCEFWQGSAHWDFMSVATDEDAKSIQKIKLKLKKEDKMHEPVYAIFLFFSSFFFVLLQHNKAIKVSLQKCLMSCSLK